MLIDITGTLVVDIRTRTWCRFPYPGHPNGCPNYGKAEQCPPKAPLVEDVFDLTEEHFFAVEQFDLKSHAQRMIALHPEWSEKQARCCLYWQNGIRKQLEKECRMFVLWYPGYTYTLIPEAMGVNVFRTAHRHGITCRKNPDVVYKIALVGKGLIKVENRDGQISFLDQLLK